MCNSWTRIVDHILLVFIKNIAKKTIDTTSLVV